MSMDEYEQRLQASLVPEWESIPDFGLYMEQVIGYVEKCFRDTGYSTGLTKSMVNNYVKSGLVDRPTGKTYTRESIAQLLMICLLKQSVSSMDMMNKLLHSAVDHSTESMYAAFRDEQLEWLRAAAGRSFRDPLAQAMQSAESLLVCRMVLDDLNEGSENEK